jgi:hypothetical protein
MEKQHILSPPLIIRTENRSKIKKITGIHKQEKEEQPRGSEMLISFRHSSFFITKENDFVKPEFFPRISGLFFGGENWPKVGQMLCSRFQAFSAV